MKKKPLSKTAASKSPKSSKSSGAKTAVKAKVKSKPTALAKGNKVLAQSKKVVAKPVTKLVTKPAPKPVSKVITRKTGLKVKPPAKELPKREAKQQTQSKTKAPKGVSALDLKKSLKKEKTPTDKALDKAELKDAKHKKEIPTDTKTTPKKGAVSSAKPATPAKKGKAPKKEVTEDVSDDFVENDDLLGDSEIAEYEEELQAVEELDEEDLDDDSADLLGSESSDEDDEIILTDAEGRRYCRVKDCDQISVVEGYCRYHYLLLWRRIQIRKKILGDGKLEKYIEELTTRYPDKFLEMIRKDLKTEKDFLSAIGELEIDESAGDGDFEEESQTFIDEVRGTGDGNSTGLEDDEF